MNYKTIITNLYYLLINADGKVNEREISLGEEMVKAEGINQTEFKVQMQYLKSSDVAKIHRDCLMGLKTLDRSKQIRSIAWLCVIANSDGFMDKTEWQFIYTIYHKELNLPLDEIMKVQKELSRIKLEKHLSNLTRVAA